MFRGWFCSSVEMLRGSCSFLLLDGVKGFIGLLARESKTDNAPLIRYMNILLPPLRKRFKVTDYIHTENSRLAS